jgi:hypothetical protein
LQMAFKSIKKNWKTEYFGLLFFYFVLNWNLFENSFKINGM